jgi:hypothetical protein
MSEKEKFFWVWWWRLKLLTGGVGKIGTRGLEQVYRQYASKNFGVGKEAGPYDTLLSLEHNPNL